MYKLTIKPDKHDTSKVITVFEKKNFYFFDYWDIVERVFCSNQYLNDHLKHYTSKYNINSGCSEIQLIEEMQTSL